MRLHGLSDCAHLPSACPLPNSSWQRQRQRLSPSFSFQIYLTSVPGVNTSRVAGLGNHSHLGRSHLGHSHLDHRRVAGLGNHSGVGSSRTGWRMRQAACACAHSRTLSLARACALPRTACAVALWPNHSFAHARAVARWHRQDRAADRHTLKYGAPCGLERRQTRALARAHARTRARAHARA